MKEYFLGNKWQVPPTPLKNTKLNLPLKFIDEISIDDPNNIF